MIRKTCASKAQNLVHSPGHLLLSLVEPSNTVDQHTVIIYYQNYSSSVVSRSAMSKQWVCCSREIRSLTNELSQMRRELQTLQWSLAEVILLMILLCLSMILVRRSLNNGMTASTSGSSVETISVQLSPPESAVMSPRGEAATTSFRVSVAVLVPSAQTVR